MVICMLSSERGPDRRALAILAEFRKSPTQPQSNGKVRPMPRLQPSQCPVPGAREIGGAGVSEL